MEIVVKANGTVTREKLEEKEVTIATKKKKKYNYDVADIEKANDGIESMMRVFRNEPLVKGSFLYKVICDACSDYDIIDRCVSEYISMRKYRTLFSKNEHYRKKYETINKTREYSIDTIIKKIAMIYFDDFVKHMPFNEVEKCDKLLKNGTTSMELLEDLNIEFSCDMINRGIKEYSALALSSAINKYYIMRRHHLCFDCQYECTLCPKIELDWEDIEKYSFITDGAQIVKNGEITKFYVYKCALEKEAAAKKKTMKYNNQ